MVERLEAESRKSYTQKAEKQRLVSETPSPLVTQGFRKLRGKLSFPVRGELVERFGRHKHDRFNAYTFSNGITLTAPLGSDIRAVSSGRVIFADPFKGYGNMLIIDHGGGYFTLYAHASLLLRKVGSMVARDEVVAKVGDLDSSHGSSLYFELRHQGKPVDPLPWFNR
jgi:septal ring factor EnvC (AmiA/AmiB activator)